MSKYKCPICDRWKPNRHSLIEHLRWRHGISNPNITGKEDYTRVIIYQPSNLGNGTMDTNIVPVTEAEMASFAQRLTTMIVGHSRQAGELQELSNRVSDLSAQVSSLRGENLSLKTERDDALMASMENEQRLNDARRHRDELQQRVTTLGETMIARDGRVKELEGLNTSAKLALEDEQRAHENTRRERDNYAGTLSTVRERRDHWHNRAEDAERALNEANAKLHSLEQTFSAIFPGAPGHAVQAVEVPAPQPDPTSGTSGPSVYDAKVEQSGSSLNPEPSRPWWEDNKGNSPAQS